METALKEPPVLSQELQYRMPFMSLEEETFLNLQRTAGQLLQSFTRTLRSFQLTPTQYNVLRILRGASPEALTCGEVGERMIAPEPDVTRLVDRLVTRGLVTRHRDHRDRRVVRVAISEEGLDLLAGLDEPVNSSLAGILSHLGKPQMQQLIHLLEEARHGA